ncbi:hypothetical protein CF319_g3937 [Tilletia indica]|nr:hypothetical protein CF319_g3937 [Tilletia indica]
MSSAQGSTSARSSSSRTSLPPPPPSSSPSPLSLSSLLLAHGLTAASLKLESVLSHTHDSIQHGVHTVLSRVEGKSEERQRGRAQVGKGKEKGSAIVLFCPSTSSNLQDLTTSLALSLASSHSPSTTAHTVLVLLTSADQLAPLLTAWAERKAAILAEERWKDLEEEEEEEEDEREEGREKIPVGRWTFSSSDEKRGGAGGSVTPPAAVLMRGEEDADWERRGAPVPRRSNGRNGGEGQGEEFVDYISGFYLSHPWHFLAYMLPAPLRIGLGYGVRVSLDLADRLGLSGYEEKQRRAERQVDDELGQQERRGRDPDPHQQQAVAPLSSTTPPTTGGSYRSRTRSIAQDVVELGRDMMKGLRIGSTSPSMSWSGTFPLPSRSPERRHPHPSRSTTAMSVAGGEGSPVLVQGSKRGTEDEGRESNWGLHWEGGLSFHLSTPWWSTLNSSRRRRSSIPTEGTDKRGKGSRKERKKKRERAQIGAVIPIFIEGERAEEKARESIQAFCEAHHLLCRGLILVPSELDGKAFLSPSPPPHLSAGDGRRNLPQETMSTTAHALPLIRALLPQLRRDQGRIVALEMVEAEGLLLLGAATSTRKDKDKTSKKRAQGQMMMSREGVYRDAVAAQRRLSGIWVEVEQEVAREEKAYRSVELAAASSSAQRSDAALSTFRSQGEWSASWQELQAEEMGSVLARVGWVGKVAWQAGVERVVRRPVRRVRGFAGWLLDVWEAEVGGGVGAVQVCRVRVAPVMGSGGGNVLPNAPTSLLSIAYPDPSQPWPPAIRKLLATYLRARFKVVPASRQIIYYFAATGLEAASQESQKRVLARQRRQEKGRDEDGGEEAEDVHGGEGASTVPESSLRQRRRPEAEPLRPVRPGSEEQSATTRGGEEENPVEGGEEQDEASRRTTSVAAVPPLPPSPPLLTKLIRSAVEDEWARSGYCVGVGGRLEGLLPGWVKAVGGWVVYQVV